MGSNLDIYDVVKGNPVAELELSILLNIAGCAIKCINNPAWAGVCDEDVLLEKAVNEWIKQY